MALPNFDLCAVADVRSWLSLNSGLGGNSSQTANINTSIPLAITAGIQTVTPVNMSGIVAGLVLNVDTGTAAELVVVTAVSSSTFTANFANSHGTNSPVEDITDTVLGRVITAASSYILWRTGRAGVNGVLPTVSQFVAPISYNENYDGNGNDRLYLNNWPIVSVTSLTINGTLIPASSGWGTVGYLVDTLKKCLVFQSAGSGIGTRYPRGYGSYPFQFSQYSVFNFAIGTQNINVQYSAGYTGTPYDLADACIKLVAFNYRRRDYYGMKQITQPASEGVLTYNSDWLVPPDVDEVIMHYSRKNF